MSNKNWRSIRCWRAHASVCLRGIMKFLGKKMKNLTYASPTFPDSGDQNSDGFKIHSVTSSVDNRILCFRNG